MEENKKYDMLFEYEMKYGDLEEIVQMLGYIIEDYYVGNRDNDVYTKANYFDRLECYLSNMYTLLSLTKKEMLEISKKQRKIEREEKLN